MIFLFYMDWKTHRAELLKDPEVRKALKATELEFQIAKAIIDARIKILSFLYSPAGSSSLSSLFTEKFLFLSKS